MTPLERIVSLLGELSAGEIVQLSAKLAALRAIGPAPSSTPRILGAGHAADSSFVELLYHAIAEGLQKHTGAQQPPFPTFARTRNGTAYVASAALAGATHAAWFPDATRAHTAALCRVYACALINYMEARRKPFYWAVISAELGNLPEVVDSAFPGYVRAGMISMLLSQFSHVAEGQA